jgi:hypothetical protein
MDTEYVPMREWQFDQISGALKPLDAKAAELEARWGRGRLEELVSPDTAAKFEAAKAKLDVAIHDNDVAMVIKRAENLMRGWEALEREAIKLGNEPAPPEIWFCHAPAEDGRPEVRFAIAKNASTANLAQTDLPVYTLDEVARIIRAWRNQHLVHAVKDIWPDAEVTKLDDIDNQEMPF